MIKKVFCVGIFLLSVPGKAMFTGAGELPSSSQAGAVDASVPGVDTGVSRLGKLRQVSGLTVQVGQAVDEPGMRRSPRALNLLNLLASASQAGDKKNKRVRDESGEGYVLRDPETPQSPPACGKSFWHRVVPDYLEAFIATCICYAGVDDIVAKRQKKAAESDAGTARAAAVDSAPEEQ